MKRKAISIRQPHAGRILRCEKTIEVRSWPTNYRGPLLICASLKPTGQGPVGVALCEVDLIDCRPYVAPDDDAAACCEGEGFAFVLANVRPVTPFAVKGRLGIFNLET